MQIAEETVTHIRGHSDETEYLKLYGFFVIEIKYNENIVRMRSSEENISDPLLVC